MTNWTNMQNVTSMLTAANDNAPFWPLMLFMMWAILIITFLPFGFSVALMSGSFIAFIIGLFLLYMDLVALKWVMGLIGIVLAIVIWDILFAKKE